MSNITYIQAIGMGFPLVQVQAIGDGSVYEDLVWVSGAEMPTKQTLDEWIASQVPADDADYRITAGAFRNRFTDEEKVEIEMSSIDDPNAPDDIRRMSAALRVYIKDLEAVVATYVDLKDLRTRKGPLWLEQIGKLAPGRALEILDGPILDKERPLFAKT